METMPIQAYLTHAGVPEAAMVDALARAQAHFGDTAPDPEALHAWGEQLRTAAPHLFAQREALLPPPAESIPSWLPATERLTRARCVSQGTPPRPQPVTLTPAQQAELAAMPPTARLTAYRALQAAGGSQEG